MDFVEITLSAVGILLGFSLASLITVLLEWMKAEEVVDFSPKNPQELTSCSHNSIPKPDGTSEIITKSSKEQSERCYFKRLCAPFKFQNSKQTLEVIINILKIISCLFTITFWTLTTLYVVQSNSIRIEDPMLYYMTIISFFLFSFIALELMLVLIYKIEIHQEAMLSKISDVVAIVSIVWVGLLLPIGLFS